RTTLHLSVPPGARRALQLREGGLIRLTLYPPPDRRQATDQGSGVGGQGSEAGPAKSKTSPPLPFLTPDPSPLTSDLSPVACLESGACMRGWVWTRPPLLVVAPLGTWREKWRRTAPRAPRQL